MGKADFTKVEGALDDGLRKIMVGKLLTDADANQGKSSTPNVRAAEKQMLIALHRAWVVYGLFYR